MLPLLKHRKRILKHTPGGQPHDQDLHGDWSDGQQEEGVAQDPAESFEPPSAPAQPEAPFGPDPSPAIPEASPTPDDFSSYKESWPEERFDSEARAYTEQAQRQVWSAMQRDPRFAEAEVEWLMMDDGYEAFESGVNEASILQSQLNTLATEVYGEHYWDDFGGSDSDLMWGLDAELDSQFIVVMPTERGFEGGFGDEWSDELPDAGELTELVGSDGWKSTLLNAVEDTQSDYGDITMSDQTYLLVGIDQEGLLPDGTPGVTAILQPSGQLGGLLEQPNAEMFGGEGGFEATPGAGFAPQTVTVPAATVFPGNHFDSMTAFDSADVPLRFKTEAGFDDLGVDIGNLGDDWNTFETDWGAAPSDLESMLEMGYQGELNGSFLENTATSLVVNDSFNGTGVSIADPDDFGSAPRILRDLWSNTSADDNPWSLAVQQAVGEEFGLDVDQLRGSRDITTLGMADEINHNFGTSLKVWARAVYDTTQQDLAARGWDIIPVTRGMKTNMPFEESWQPIAGDLNPISSFTVTPHTAISFAGNNSSQTKTLFRGWVPASQVWGSSLTGNGAMREQELIILGGEDSFHGEIWNDNSHVSERIFNE